MPYYEFMTITNMNKKLKSGKMKWTTQSLRSEVYKMQKVANKIIADSPTGGINRSMSEDVAKWVNPKSKISDGFIHIGDVSRKGKAELMDVYNNLAMFINEDVESTVWKGTYDEKTDVARKKIQKQLGYRITQQDMEDFLKFKDEYGDLLDGDKYRYDEVLKTITGMRKRGKKHKPLYTLIKETEKELGESGSYTPSQVMQTIYNKYGYDGKKGGI